MVRQGKAPPLHIQLPHETSHRGERLDNHNFHENLHDCNLSNRACRLRHTASVDLPAARRRLERESQGGAPFCFIMMKLHLDTREADFNFLMLISLGLTRVKVGLSFENSGYSVSPRTQRLHFEVP